MRLTGPRRTIGRTFLELQEFYLDAGGRERLRGMGRMRRTIYAVAWLLKSLFLKLTPARRVLLALSVVLIWQATNVGRSGEPTPGGSYFPILGVATLLLVLLLQ